MKTIILCHQSGNLYGSDKVFLDLVKILAPRFKTVVVLDTDGPLTKELNKHTKYTYIRNLGSLRRRKSFIKTLVEFISALFFLNRLILEYQPYIVVTNTIIIVSLAIIAKIRKVNHVWFVHEQPKTAIEKFFFKNFLYNLSDKIIVPSNPVLNWLGENKKVEFLPYIESIKRPNINTYKKMRQRWMNGKRSIILGCVGMFHPKKGQDYLIKIAKLLINNNKKLKFIFLGGKIEGYEQYYNNIRRSISENNLTGYFSIEGFKKEIVDWISALDVVVIPSQYKEPFPLVFQESMKLGKPVIASDLGVFRELIKDNFNGILIPPADAEKAAERILKFLGNKRNLKKISENCRRFYEQHFIYNEYEAKISSLFND